MRLEVPTGHRAADPLQIRGDFPAHIALVEIAETRVRELGERVRERRHPADRILGRVFCPRSRKVAANPGAVWSAAVSLTAYRASDADTG